MELVITQGFIEINSVLDRTVIRYFRKNIEKHTNYHNFLDMIKPELIEKLRNHVSPLEYTLKLEATYDVPNVERSAQNRSFNTTAKPIFLDSDIETLVEYDFSTLLAEKDTYSSGGSGFSLSHIDGLLLTLPLNATSYIKLHSDKESKKAIINPQNIDHL